MTNLNLISKSKAAKLLNIGKSALDKLIQKQKIKVIRIGKRTKIPYSELESFINRNTAFTGGSEFITGLSFSNLKTSKQNQFDSKSFFESLIEET